MRVRMPGTRMPARTSSQSQTPPDDFCMYSTEHMATSTQTSPVNAACSIVMPVRRIVPIIHRTNITQPAFKCFGRLLIFSHPNKLETLFILNVV